MAFAGDSDLDLVVIVAALLALVPLCEAVTRSSTLFSVAMATNSKRQTVSPFGRRQSVSSVELSLLFPAIFDILYAFVQIDGTNSEYAHDFNYLGIATNSHLTRHSHAHTIAKKTNVILNKLIN